MALKGTDEALRRGKRALWLPLSIWAVLAVGLNFAAPLLNAVQIHGFPFAYYMAAQGVPIIFVLLAFWAAAPWRETASTSAGSSLLAGLSAAGLWMSGAACVALVGVLYADGYDGLAWLLGLTGGFVLIVAVIVPAISATQAAGVADFLTKRTGGRLAALAATVIALAALTLLVSAELDLVRRLAAVVFVSFEGATGVPSYAGIAFAAVAAVILAILQTRPANGLQAAIYLVILVVITFVAGSLTLAAFAIPVPPIAYGPGLKDLGPLERQLILDGLSDPSVVRPFAKSNTSLSAENFLALSLSLMLGAAALPHLLGRLAAAGPSPAPRHTAAWALFFIVALVVTLPAIAVVAKLDVYSAIARGATPDTAPAWLTGQAYSETPSLCAEGCTHPEGRLRVQDVTIEPEAILPSAPLIAGMPKAASWCLAGLLAIAALLSAGRIIAAMMGMLGGGAPANDNTAARGVLFFGLAVILAAAAGGTALGLEASLVTRIAWALSLAAAGLFPMLLAAALLQRASSLGLALGGVAGFAVALYYIVGTEVFPLHFLDLWRDYSNMPPWRFEVFDEVRQSCLDGIEESCTEAVDVARELANWFGLDTRASGIIGAPVGFAVALIASIPAVFRRRAPH